MAFTSLASGQIQRNAPQELIAPLVLQPATAGAEDCGLLSSWQDNTGPPGALSSHEHPTG